MICFFRVSLSNDTYRVIKPPVDAKGYCSYQVLLRSKNGVYFVYLDNDWRRKRCWLQVWILNESCGQTEWIPKLDKDLNPLLACRRFHGRDQWILEDINYNMFRSSSCPEENKKAISKGNIEWNSDGDVEDEHMVDHCYLEDNKKFVVERKLEWNSNHHNALNNGDTFDECFLDEPYDYDVEILSFTHIKRLSFSVHGSIQD